MGEYIMTTETVKIEGTIIAIWCKFFKRYDYKYIHLPPESSYYKENGFIQLAPYTIEIEIPNNIDLNKMNVEVLKEQRKIILASNEIEIKEIDDEIQSFMAIENKG